jgi:hypothetical protein
MPNPEKVKALLQFKPPFKIKQAEAFLGKATYYKSQSSNNLVR